ncbi:DNA polymerase subunit gamma-2, mitochondrial [Colletes gigas]|uniref:DNA polymerase subunit gamma-2, mitochondrial n=1 Tax=Colletes gigas TaxID=935657 RepID=UPI001C9B9CF6|nr:DNA polymerase subunit gamma-2, mitochondrial [Colletes gigas]
MNIIRILKELNANFINLAQHDLIYGPQGRMLLKNLEDHWFLHCVTMSRYNIFLSDKITDTLNFITKTAMDDIPFGLATIKNSKNQWNQTNIPSNCEFKPHRTAEIAVFNNDIESKNLYHKLQKERKIWWRKIAQFPFRFKVTESKKIKNFDTVDVEAHFSFGTIVVERITYHTDVRKLFSQIDNKKDFTNIQMVEHTVSLDWGCLALLCDAYDTDKSVKMQIHFKLAPHKVAICIKKWKNEMNIENDDLNHFVLYLNNMLRTEGLNTILTSSQQVIETCLVPFVVLVDRTSLENGIIHVTNRSTTLSEAIHITDLAKYIIMHC